MTRESDLILPTTKVATFLQLHPELEDELIAFAPPFKKLKNPLLRNSIGKVATLRQAAGVARVPVRELVDHLRVLVGQPPLEGETEPDEDYLVAEPAWFAAHDVVDTLDEREEDPEQTQMAIVPLTARARALEPGEMVELLTTFIPAPGIGVLRRNGHRTWCREDPDGTVHTFVACRG